MPAATSSASPRLYFLDWLRIGAFALLVLYHVGMVYVSWDFHVKSPHAGPALEPWMRLSSPWRMSLLFLISGAVTAVMLGRRVGGGFMQARSKRLLAPLLFGMLVIVPPQAYVEVVHKLAYDGSYLDFMALYLTGYGGFCEAPGRCLILPTWNHLWFIPYLWVYTALLWLLLRRWPGALDALAGRLGAVMHHRLAWMGLPVAALWLARLGLAQRFPSTHALVDDWFNHVQYLGFFVAGAAFVRLPGVWTQMTALRWPALGLALAAWAVPVILSLPVSPAAMLLRSGMQWWAIVALLGFAHRHLNVDHPWRAPLNEAVFTVYLLHQTVLVLAFHAVQRWQLAPAVEGALLVGLTFAFSLLGWRLARRVGWLRPWVGLGAMPARPASAGVCWHAEQGPNRG